jgi:hypothetical protein
MPEPPCTSIKVDAATTMSSSCGGSQPDCSCSLLVEQPAREPLAHPPDCQQLRGCCRVLRPKDPLQTGKAACTQSAVFAAHCWRLSSTA